MYIDGLYLKNYMGIGTPAQKMAPFKRFNFFIGANNSGKSIPLNFISKYLSAINLKSGEQRPTISRLEEHMDSGGGGAEFGLAIPKEKFISAIHSRGPEYIIRHSDLLLDKVCEFLIDEGFIWLISSVSNAVFKFSRQIGLGRSGEILNPNEWQVLWQGLTGQNSGSLEHHWVPETLGYLLSSQTFQIPETILIPAIRQIRPSVSGVRGNDGAGLIDQLAELQNPDHDRRHDKLLFEKINRFLQTVTDTQDAYIDIPHNRAHVLVHMNGRVLPLLALGTGIHEVVMLAAACTIHQQKIVCVEEPEIHLHPILQRKFMRFLIEHTDNQYFIATHSPSFIDTSGAAIFHVSHDRTKTTIKESILKSDRYAICVDLGHKASDIVQANAVIWVEGPSERIYLQHWITSADPGLIEGMHYSIMFYGGRLLSHLSADDTEVQAFIDLRTLNQNLAVVMDSDREAQESPINSTKQRIIDEFSSRRGVPWITAGREIENYIDYDLLQRGLSKIHPNLYHNSDKSGRFDHAFYFRMAKTQPQVTGPPTYVFKGADKVKLAKWVCTQPANLDVLDLRERIGEIVEMIKKAND
ncbi:AAA family ATPase [Methylobacterium sp. WL8]|uniref:AAA family ATPase n=1 Tax=Methylobacterium sp. WL8 TaxID=2603899 RepID=UPI0011CB5A6B|nr:AAA family ATPase [Methylobacterium sp. WL8]TXN82900.1 AAA family ATPase [Methylobacterium sp. WL8]